MSSHNRASMGMMTKIVFLFILMIVMIHRVSGETPQNNSDYLRLMKAKMEIKKKLIQESQSRLQYEKNRLSMINEREQDLSSQLEKTESDLWEVEETIRNIKDRRIRIGIELTAARNELEALKKQLDKTQRTLSERMKDIYMNREIDYFAVILESESFSDFINRVEFIERIVRGDTSLIREVREERKKIREEQERLQSLESELSGLEHVYRKKQTQYTTLTSTRTSLLVQVQYKRNCIANNVYELEVLTRDMELQLEKMIREAQAANQDNTGSAPIVSERNFVWPVRGIVTSPYGYRMHPIRGRVIFHSGLDIGAMYGTPICAAASGIIIYSGWYGGYGNAVIIDHGNGYSTLYGHCSSLFVSQAQKVRQGSIIASVGSTGLSTGPHLHFEIRQNGVPIDPRSRL